jgi:hypothetical protein
LNQGLEQESLEPQILLVSISLSFMDKLTLFGLFAVIAMLVCYAFENRSTWFILAFAGACVLGSAYGFLQGGCRFARQIFAGQPINEELI